MLDSFRVSYYPVVLLQIGLAAARKKKCRSEWRILVSCVTVVKRRVF